MELPFWKYINARRKGTNDLVLLKTQDSEITEDFEIEEYMNNYFLLHKLYTSFPVQQCELAVTKVNEDLCKIRDWCFDNRLLLNASKTKLILFGSR